MFNPKIITFFENLENNNNKDWFTDHKSEYEELVKEPVKQLADSFEFEFGYAHIFRVNKDARFSSDKTPYKTNASFFIGGSGGFGLYFQVSKLGFQVAGGSFDTQSDQLEKWRQSFGSETGETIKNFLLKMKEKNLVLNEENMLKSAPRGYPKDHTDLYYLQLKHLTLGKSYFNNEVLFTEQLQQTVHQDFKLLKEWCNLLDSHVGATKIEKKRH